MINATLAELLDYVRSRSPYYRERLPANANAELSELPFTTKDDLATHSTGFLAVPEHEIRDYASTSGTLGEPVYFGLTANDLLRLAENECQSFRISGASAGDVIQLMVTMDKLFMAGLAYFLGIQQLGATAIRTGPGNPMHQLEVMLKFKTTVIVAIPSFIIRLIQVARDRNINLADTAVKSIICIGEPIRNTDFSLNELGKSIVSEWPVNLHSTYASTEMATAFTECEYGCGGHLNPELLLLEVIGEDNLPVQSGETGEVVVTPLGIEGQPLIRYRTGDLCAVHYNKCLCGRDTPRLGPVIGRKQQMIKFKGTTLFPSALFDVLATEHIPLYQVQVHRDPLGNDDLKIALPAGLEGNTTIDYLRSAFRSRLRVTPDFVFMAEEQLQLLVNQPDKRKPERVVFFQ